MTRFCFLITASLLLTTCSGPQGSDEKPTRPDLENLPIFNIEEQFRISAFDEDVFFASISDVAVGHDQTIFVSDRGVEKIYMFDQQGNYKGYLGGDGEGPGEFRQIISMSLLTPDTLQVFDWQLARITFFSKQNSHWTPVRYLDRPEGFRKYGADMFFTFNTLYPHPDGYLVRFRSSFTPVDTATHSFAYYTLYDYRLNPVNEREYLMRAVSKAMVNRVSGRSVSVAGIPERHKMLFSVTSDAREISTWTGGRQVTIQHITQEDSTSFIFPSRRVPLTDEDKTALVERFSQNDRINSRQVKEHIPEYKGFSRSLHVDDQDRIWILARPFEEDDPEWLIYSMDGELLAASPHPGGTLQQIKGNRMYVSFTSAGEEPAFGVFDIVEPGSPD